MPIVSTPPPAGAPRTASSAKTTAKKSMLEQRTEVVAGLGQLAQVPLLTLKQYADAGAVALYWPKVSEEIAKLADSQPAIANLVDPLMKVGPYTGLVAALLPFCMQIAVNHGRVAPGAMGTVPATTLEAQIQTAMAQTELEALRMQREAEEKSSRLRLELRAMTDAMQDHAHETADAA